MDFQNNREYDERATRIRVNGPLAMAYVPTQKFTHLYSAAEGYHRGTIFKELDLPFKGGKNK